MPFPFSVIAKTEIKALEISKKDIQSKLPYSFRALLEQNAIDRNMWQQQRIREITKTSHIIYKQDYKQAVYDKVMNQLISRHPQANSNALKCFTNHHVKITGMDNTGRIMKKVASNQREPETSLDISGCDIDLNTQKETRKLRENSSYYRTQSKMVNKACFISEIASVNDYQNCSTDVVTSNEHTRRQTAPYGSTPRKELIEMAQRKFNAQSQ